MADVTEILIDGTVIERDFTETELAQIEIDKKTALAKQAEIKAKEAKRKEILNRLGLSADEVQILLG